MSHNSALILLPGTLHMPDSPIIILEHTYICIIFVGPFTWFYFIVIFDNRKGQMKLKPII